MESKKQICFFFFFLQQNNVKFSRPTIKFNGSWRWKKKHAIFFSQKFIQQVKLCFHHMVFWINIDFHDLWKITESWTILYNFIFKEKKTQCGIYTRFSFFFNFFFLMVLKSSGYLECQLYFKWGWKLSQKTFFYDCRTKGTDLQPKTQFLWFLKWSLEKKK